MWVSACPPPDPALHAELRRREAAQPDCAAAPPHDYAPRRPTRVRARAERYAGPEDEPVWVEFGEMGQPLGRAVNATTFGYAVVGWNWTLHAAVMTGLAPSTQYTYRVGGATQGFTATSTFRSAPPLGVPDRPLRVVLTGDMGTDLSGTGFVTAERLFKDDANDAFDLMVIAGDVAYGYLLEPLWDAWFRHISPVASMVPTMICPGNQDADFDFAGLRNRFTMPWQRSNSSSPYYYSFDFGNVHFVAFSTEHDYSVGSDQYEWMAADLAAASQSSTADWVVVYAHRPMYCSNLAWCPSATNLRNTLEPLLIKYRVDIAFYGHVHAFERTWPVANSVTQQKSYVNAKAPIHLIAGTAGALLCDYWEAEPDWSAFRTLQFGYSLMSVHNATHIHYQFKEQLSGVVYDDIWIVKGV